MMAVIFPTFTIAINAHNYARYLSDAIDSVLSQDYPEDLVEILIIDDGSTDETADIARRYQSRIQYFYQENRGQASAIVAGLAKANGDVICLLDADDWFYPDKLRTIATTLSEHPNAGAVYNRYDMIMQNGLPSKQGCPQKLNTEKLASLAMFWQAGGVPTSSISLCRDVAKRIQIPEEPFKICADSFLLCAVPFLADVVGTMNSLTAYRVHGNNSFIALSRGDRIKKFHSTAFPIRVGMKEIYGVSLYGAPFDIPMLVANKQVAEAIRECLSAVMFIARYAPRSIAIKEYVKLLACVLSSIQKRGS